MPRMLLMTAQSDPAVEETEAEVDNQGLLAAMAIVCRMWGEGRQPPGIDTHVEKVRLVDSNGNWQGFGYYLVAGEARNLGAMKQVVIGEGGSNPPAPE